MELQQAQGVYWHRLSFCMRSPNVQCLHPRPSSIRFLAISRCPTRFTCPPQTSKKSHSCSFCVVAKAKQTDGKAAAPPRPELWELREYEDPDAEEGDQEKKSRHRVTFETEAEARRHHWISRMWAPWEEALGPEARFAVDALNLDQGDEPIVTREMMDRLNENKPLIPDDQEYLEDLDVIEAKENDAIPGTAWQTPMVFSFVPPRDWPPPGWKVDPDELAFIRGIHGILDTRPGPVDLSNAAPLDDNTPSQPRWEMFLKQYEEWVAANKERLDREAEEWGDEYYPGRRKMGKEYVEGMYELPFIYPGQHYLGEVTMIHLYEGAHVNFGAVYDGWVPIKRNDWYWVRNIVKVGMKCQVEVVAKRDPYRFRFPVELCFVYPNIDHLIFNRFDYPPIFVRDGDEECMDLVRESGRPFWPSRRPELDDDEEDEEEEDKTRPPKYNHPYSFKVWQLHEAEQMLLDEEERLEAGIVKPPQQLNEITTERDYLDPDTFWTEERLGDKEYLSLVLTQHEWELDMDSARKEREENNKIRAEIFASGEGESYVRPKLQRTKYIEQLDIMNWQRYLDQFEAVQRDRINRLELGLPLEEPGRYADDSFFGENQYNPREKRWRHDYLGDVLKSKDESRQQRTPQSKAFSSDSREDVGGNVDREDVRDSVISDEIIESEVVDFSGGTQDGIEGFKEDEDVTGNVKERVNGTESSRVLDVNGLPQFIDEDRSEDESE
ncbi:hypothetical protein KP509_02G035300 [Ceratopteris richardii]|uniref:S1 motif domain-containing protein n=1 Tax=Ceratopteris richardii TaxID=49495 RepID=A0A8T2VCG2_CERRI|nr:hypothetical protein KP509_02G035300 [Ceratopteris richardii]